MWKPANPKDAIGIKKSYQSVIPLPVLHEVGLAMLEGALKYRRHNYRVMGVRAGTYYDACRRHIDCWWEGEDIDPDSGLPHLAKAMACLVILRDAHRQGKLTDDRPPRTDQGWMEEINRMAAALVARYPNPEDAFTQEGSKE